MGGTRTAAVRATRRAALAAALGLAAAAPPVAAACEAWPGEPDPLPTVTDVDALRAEWASLRGRELTALAERFERRDDPRSLALWQHLLCLDPENAAARAGVARSAAVRVHRPPLGAGPADSAGEGWARGALTAPLGLPGASPPNQQLLAEVRELDEQVRRARFDRALERAAALRRRVSALPPSSDRAGLLVETEVLAATAELALGRPRQAEASLGRALDVYPGLELDPAKTSPKVLRALEAARAARGGERP